MQGLSWSCQPSPEGAAALCPQPRVWLVPSHLNFLPEPVDTLQLRVKDPGIPRGRTLLQNEVYRQECLEMLRREAPRAGAGWA